MTKMLSTTLFAATLVVTGAASATFDYEDLKRGWFWYEDPPVIEELEHEEITEEEIQVVVVEDAAKPEPAPTQTGPRFMTTAWLRDSLPVALEAAIDNPNPDNIRRFAYLQRISFDKAEQFARNYQQVVLSDPVLDENNRMPMATFARRIMRDEQEDEKNRQLSWLSEQVGFFYFHDETCAYCIHQIPILEAVKKHHDFEIMAISMDGTIYDGVSFPSRINDGHAKRFMVSQVPAIVMVWPPDNAAVLSQSLISRVDFERRAMVVAEASGLLTEEVFADLGISRPSFVNNELLDADEFERDPNAFIRRLRAEMGYE